MKTRSIISSGQFALILYFIFLCFIYCIFAGSYPTKHLYIMLSSCSQPLIHNIPCQGLKNIQACEWCLQEIYKVQQEIVG